MPQFSTDKVLEYRVLMLLHDMRKVNDRRYGEILLAFAEGTRQARSDENPFPYDGGNEAVLAYAEKNPDLYRLIQTYDSPF